MTFLTTIPLFFIHLCDKFANRIQPRSRVICTSPFAAVERTQQRKLEELLLAAAREGRTAELTALVKKKMCYFFMLWEIFNLKLSSYRRQTVGPKYSRSE